MTRRERLMRTLRGEPVDRPAVCFYEINGLTQDPLDPDPYNIFSHPSWLPLIELARDRSDRIVLRGVATKSVDPNSVEQMAEETVEETDGRRFVTRTIRIGSGASARVLTQRTRRDRDINTVWHIEHLLKDREDLEAFLTLPEGDISEAIDPNPVLEAERLLGDTGIAALDTADPLCLAASLFDLGTYTVLAMTEPVLFRRLLDRFARVILPRTRAAASALPGRLWRIFGPEYASEPYLPPALFHEYVCEYVRPMVAAIQEHGGFARIHSHGNLRGILDHIEEIGADGLDPIEPPPQGDIELREVRERLGVSTVLFGNLEVNDIENLSTPEFSERVRRALDEGTRGDGRGFVLMPSAAPYGREFQPRSLANYEAMVRIVEEW